MNPLRRFTYRQADEDHEDLMTFLINERSQHQNSSSEVEEQDVGISPQPSGDRITPISYEQARVRNTSISAFTSNKDERARRPALEYVLNDFPFSESGVLDARLDTECYVPSPKSQFTDLGDSPLFVPKEKKPSSSIPIAYSASTPSSAHSNNDPVSDCVQTRYVRNSQGGRFFERDSPRAGSVEKTIMGDVFLKSDYVKNLQKNPYTSGIFAYEGKEKRAYEGTNLTRKKRRRLNESLGGDTNAVLESNSLPEVGISRSLNTIPPMEHLSTQNRRGSQSRYATAFKAPALLSDTRRTSLQSGGSQAVTKAARRTHSTPSTPKLNTPRPEPSRGSSHLATFFFEKAYACEKALSDVGCSYETNSHTWNFLEESLAADVRMFVQKLHSGSHDESDMKTTLQAWDTAISIQALLQKYKMYTSLLKATV